MTLRTPRRRISPRTKRRYRAIRNFFRKTLGSLSQPDIKINSSIAVNVTDLKHKILGLEHQLDEVSKRCRTLVSLESLSRAGVESLETTEGQGRNDKNSRDFSIEGKSNENETKFLYKTSDTQFKKTDDSASASKLYDEPSEQVKRTSDRMNDRCKTQISKNSTKRSKRDTEYQSYVGHGRNKHRTQSVYEPSIYSSGSYRSITGSRLTDQLAPEYSRQINDKKETKKHELAQPLFHDVIRDKKNRVRTKRNKSESPARTFEDKHEKHKNNKPLVSLDQDFITDIIKRQYKPVKLFGRRESDLSQISSPVCRDQEYSLHENLVEDSELCSCCHAGREQARYRYVCHDLADMRSICDTRLYSTRRHRPRNRRAHVDIYNDSNLYDVVPVKEKSSPKSRRKFVEDNMISCDHYREVPPSPRSQRPRLNLRAQPYIEGDDYMVRNKSLRRRRSPNKLRKQESVDNLRSDTSSEESIRHVINTDNPKVITPTKNAQVQEDMGTMSSLQYPYAIHKTIASNNCTLNKTNETDSNADKTDKALCEIKDILQSFLQEIKKDATAVENDKSSESTEKAIGQRTEEVQPETCKVNSTMPKNGQSSFNNYSVTGCSVPYLPSFANPCCYPLMPVCPMNCVQNGYIIPSSSFTCTTCINNQKDSDVCRSATCPKHNNIEETPAAKKISETEQLIREIYKFVAQNTKGDKANELSYSNDNSSCQATPADVRVPTAKTTWKETFIAKHDANVGTASLKCYSKSCEAIGQRVTSECYTSRTNASYSDTLLEKLSLEATTQSTSESDSTESSVIHKQKESKFANVLRSFGLIKKKKPKDVIEELSESETTIHVKTKRKPPYRQDLTDYVMHGQEFYHPPPLPPLNQCYFPRSPDPRYEYGLSPYDYRVTGYTGPKQPDIYPQRQSRSPAQCPAIQHAPSAPPYPAAYEPHCGHNLQPQVPLCLKEIEVKSIGTQSDRKTTFFSKFAMKMQPSPSQGDDPKNCSTQTAQEKPTLFNWKGFQTKATPPKSARPQKYLDPYSFSLKTQKQLAEGDTNIRNTMLKKLFHKKNPFSPRNLIVKTLLGKDKSSWGEPPNISPRPRLFL